MKFGANIQVVMADSLPKPSDDAVVEEVERVTIEDDEVRAWVVFDDAAATVDDDEDGDGWP
jgi:hypothetical protein